MGIATPFRKGRAQVLRDLLGFCAIIDWPPWESGTSADRSKKNGRHQAAHSEPQRLPKQRVGWVERQRNLSISCATRRWVSLRSTHPTNFEEPKRDPDFLEDSIDAVVTIVTPQPLPAEAQAS